MTPETASAPEIPRQAAQILDQSGQSLLDLAGKSPVVVLFLRHTGCTFCREMLAELAERRAELAASGIGAAIVHLQEDRAAVAQLLARYGLEDVPCFADPGQTLYAAFELARGSAADVLGPKVWWRGFETTILRGHLPGRPRGDIYQLPGAFLLANGRVLAAFRAETSADRVPWQTLTTCDSTACQLPPVDAAVDESHPPQGS